MGECCFFIPLKRSVTILGFLSLIISIAELLLSYFFSHGNIEWDALQSKTGHIVELLDELVKAKQWDNGQIEKLKGHSHLILQCIFGMFELVQSKLKYIKRHQGQG